MPEIINERTIRPFVRCVGRGHGLYQKEFHQAFDHRLICVLDGTGSIDIGGETLPLMPGQAFIISPGTPYRVRSDAHQQVFVINFDWTWANADRTEVIRSVYCEAFRTDEIVGAADFSLLFDGSGGYAAAGLHADAAGLLARMLHEYLAGGTITALRLSSQFFYFITCMLTPPAKEGHAMRTARELHAWIVEHSNEPITIADAAAAFHYGKSYISKLLRRHYGTGFKQLVIDCRLSRAVWLMENTQLSREEIAARTGFYNSQHFSRAYQKKYSCNPTRDS